MVMLNVFLFTSVTAIRGNGEGQGNFSNDGKKTYFGFCFVFCSLSDCFCVLSCIKNLQFIYPFTSDKIWLDLIHTILSFLFSLWDFSLSLLSIVRIETKSTVLPHLLNKHKVALFLLRLLLHYMSIVLIPCGSCIWQKSCFPFYLQKCN